MGSRTTVEFGYHVYLVGALIFLFVSRVYMLESSP